MDEQEFRRRADAALEALKRSLYAAEGDSGFEVEENSGALNISFDEKNDFVLGKTGEGLKPLVARLINEQIDGGTVALG
jgi:CyaY protein